MPKKDKNVCVNVEIDPVLEKKIKSIILPRMKARGGELMLPKEPPKKMPRTIEASNKRKYLEKLSYKICMSAKDTSSTKKKLIGEATYNIKELNPKLKLKNVKQQIPADRNKLGQQQTKPNNVVQQPPDPIKYTQNTRNRAPGINIFVLNGSNKELAAQMKVLKDNGVRITAYKFMTIEEGTIVEKQLQDLYANKAQIKEQMAAKHRSFEDAVKDL